MTAATVTAGGVEANGGVPAGAAVSPLSRRELDAPGAGPVTVTGMRRTLIDLPQLAPLDLPAAEVDLIARNSTEVSIPAGDRLARQGELGRQVFLLLDGQADVVRNGEVLGTAGALEPVGEIGMGPERFYRVADVYATTDVEALVFSFREWSTVRAKAPRFAELVATVGSRRLAELAA